VVVIGRPAAATGPVSIFYRPRACSRESNSRSPRTAIVAAAAAAAAAAAVEAHAEAVTNANTASVGRASRLGIGPDYCRRRGHRHHHHQQQPLDNAPRSVHLPPTYPVRVSVSEVPECTWIASRSLPVKLERRPYCRCELGR